MTIRKAEYQDYQRLKKLEAGGHLLTADALRFIISAYHGDPEQIGKHFMEIYARWQSERRST